MDKTRPTVLGIKCWVCREDTDKGCDHPFDGSKLELKDCDDGDQQITGKRGDSAYANLEMNACGKATYRNISDIEAGRRQWLTVRECASFEEHCARDQGKYWCEELTLNATSHQMIYYACGSDGCNGATDIRSQGFTSAVHMFSLLIAISCLL